MPNKKTPDFYTVLKDWEIVGRSNRPVLENNDEEWITYWTATAKQIEKIEEKERKEYIKSLSANKKDVSVKKTW